MCHDDRADADQGRAALHAAARVDRSRGRLLPGRGAGAGADGRRDALGLRPPRRALRSRPQDVPFVEEMEDLANSACAWGSVCNAGAGMGRFVSDLYGAGRFSTFTRTESPYRRLT